MAEDYHIQLRNRINELFDKFIEPLLHELISEYSGINGVEAKITSEGPVMMGIERYASILFRNKDGVEHVICIYWIGGEEKIITENLRMITLNRSFDIYHLDTSELRRTVKLLAGLGRL